MMNANATLQLPFHIGETWWAARTHPEKVRVSCPVCAGSRVVTVLYGGEDGERVTVACDACGAGFEGPRGYVEEYEHSPAAQPFVIREIESMHDGRWRVCSTTGASLYFDELFATEAEAFAASEEACARYREDNMQRRQWKRGNVKKATWSVLYHKNCIKDLERQLAWHRECIAKRPVRPEGWE